MKTNNVRFIAIILVLLTMALCGSLQASLFGSSQTTNAPAPAATGLVIAVPDYMAPQIEKLASAYNRKLNSARTWSESFAHMSDSSSCASSAAMSDKIMIKSVPTKQAALDAVRTGEANAAVLVSDHGVPSNGHLLAHQVELWAKGDASNIYFITKTGAEQRWHGFVEFAQSASGQQVIERAGLQPLYFSERP